LLKEESNDNKQRKCCSRGS